LHLIPCTASFAKGIYHWANFVRLQWERGLTFSFSLILDGEGGLAKAVISAAMMVARWNMLGGDVKEYFIIPQNAWGHGVPGILH